MEKQTHFDFVTGIFLLILSVVMIIDSYRMGVEVGGALYASPGMLPMVLAVMLLLTSGMLVRRSVQQNGAGRNFADFLAWFNGFRKSATTREMLLGGAMLALYTFVLTPRMPFWMSTSIFMILVMVILKATSIIKNVVITAVVVGSIYGVFQSIFHVPLP